MSAPHCQPLGWLASPSAMFSLPLYVKTQTPQSPAWGWLYPTHSRTSFPLYMFTLLASSSVILQQVPLCRLTVLLEDTLLGSPKR